MNESIRRNVADAFVVVSARKRLATARNEGLSAQKITTNAQNASISV